MTLMLSVILCSHNPRLDYLDQVLTALQQQSLPQNNWELILIDNASTIPLAEQLNLDWHPQGRIVVEKRLGLTNARLRGFQESQGEYLVFVDDDNVLALDYLEQVMVSFQKHQDLGALAGKSLPQFECQPESWVTEFHQILALRDFGPDPLIAPGQLASATPTYPDFAPSGAGMAVRRQAFLAYVEHTRQMVASLALGRIGKQLSSGEDNDIILTVLGAGWGVGYFPTLQLMHLIAAKRCDRNYLGRLNQAASRSWVQVLDLHGIRMWPKIPRWTVLFRKARSFFRERAWQHSAAYIRWRGYCGIFEGQSYLS